jgi:ATP-dependent DNA helicase RecG
VARLLLAVTGEMTRKEIQHILSLRHEDHFRAAYLMRALTIGMLEMTLPDMPRSSKQRYRLTALGRQWIQQHRSE